MQAVTITQINVEELEKIIERCLLRILNSDRFKTTIVPDDDILDIWQTAEFLRLEKPTVYTLVSKREIPFMKPGKKLYFSKNQLVKWLKDSGRKVKNKEFQ